MARLTTIAVAFGLAASAAAQSSTITAGPTTTGAARPTGSVVNITYPSEGGDVDEQALVGSIIGSSGAVTTIAVGCPPGADSNDCGYTDSVTFEFGSSTFHVRQTVSNIISEGDTAVFTIEQNCQYTPSQGGACQTTQIGAASNFGDDSTATTSVAPTVTLTYIDTTTYAASALSTLPVTVTASAQAGSGNGRSSSTSPTGTNAAPLPTGMAPGWVGAAAVGFAAILL